MPPFRTQRRVEFHHTDAAGIAHFSAFFQFMEEAEHELLRSLDLSVLVRNAEGALSWPRVNATCEFHGAVRFEDVLDVVVRLERLGERSATYGFTFAHAGRLVATGRLVSVCCRLAEGQPPQSVDVPDWIRQRLHAAIGEDTTAPPDSKKA
jgi:4-hydroxybenzoyl-CoA thioesterase/acyl-CoA thioester hydrolase